MLKWICQLPLSLPPVALSFYAISIPLLDARRNDRCKFAGGKWTNLFLPFSPHGEGRVHNGSEVQWIHIALFRILGMLEQLYRDNFHESGGKEKSFWAYWSTNKNPKFVSLPHLSALSRRRVPLWLAKANAIDHLYFKTLIVTRLNLLEWRETHNVWTSNELWHKAKCCIISWPFKYICINDYTILDFIKCIKHVLRYPKESSCC